jgi:hypothetical protein
MKLNEIFDDPRFREPRSKKDEPREDNDRVGLFVVYGDRINTMFASEEEAAKYRSDDVTSPSPYQAFFTAPASATLGRDYYMIAFDKRQAGLDNSGLRILMVLVGDSVNDAYHKYRDYFLSHDSRDTYSIQATGHQIALDDFPELRRWYKSLDINDFQGMPGVASNSWKRIRWNKN